MASPLGCRSKRRSGTSTPATSARSSSRVASRPGKSNPASRRTVLVSPSQPTTYAARTRSVAAAPPAPGSASAVASTARSVVRSSVSRWPLTTRAPSRVAQPSRSSSVRTWGTFHWPEYGLAVVRSSGVPPKCPAPPAGGVPSSASRPRWSRISIVRACRVEARDSVSGPVRRSSTTTSAPPRASSPASIRPTGPAPTTSTCVSMSGVRSIVSAVVPGRSRRRGRAWRGCWRSARRARTRAPPQPPPRVRAPR